MVSLRTNIGNFSNIKIQTISGVLSSGGFVCLKVFYFLMWLELRYNLNMLYCELVKMWCK